MRRRVPAVVLALALGVAATSCSTLDADDGCPPVAIGFVGALTGSSAASGAVKRNSAALAVREYNAANPDCPVGLISFDSQGRPAQAEALAPQIVDDPQIIAVLGPVFSGETEAVMPVFDDAGLAVVTPSATNARLGVQGWEAFHRFVSNDAAQGPAVAAWLAEGVGVDRVAVIDDGSLYGEGLAEIVVEELVGRGVEVPLLGEVDAEQLDYTEVIEMIALSEVDVVFFGGLSTAGTQLYRQMRAAGLDMMFAGADGMLLDDFLEAAAGDENVLVTCPCIGSAITDAQQRFADDYRQVFGQPVSNYAAESYDATRLLLGLIAEGATTRSEISEALQTVVFEGITKTVGFDERGEATTVEVYLFDVVDGMFTPRVVIRDGDLVTLD